MVMDSPPARQFPGSGKPPVHGRRRLVSTLSLCLAAVMALPWPVALASVEGASCTAPAHTTTQLESGVKLRLTAAGSHAATPLDSATIGTLLTGLEDDDCDDCLLIHGLTDLPVQDVHRPSVPAFSSVRRDRVLISTAPGHLPLRC